MTDIPTTTKRDAIAREAAATLGPEYYICQECHMPLIDPAERHPWEACEMYRRTHDANAVRQYFPGSVRDVRRAQPQRAAGAPSFRGRCGGRKYSFLPA